MTTIINKTDYNDASKEEIFELEEQNNLINDILNKRDDGRIVADESDENDIRCGLGSTCLRNEWLQRYATKNTYVFVYGVLGCLSVAAYAYFNGTLTMIEKRFKIPSQKTGFISVGNDISSLFLSAIISYYGGYGHRPRWIAFGMFLIGTFCLITALPQFIYGSGDFALSLTQEYYNHTDNHFLNSSNNDRLKTLCQNSTDFVFDECTQNHNDVNNRGDMVSQIILFTAQLISGVGTTLYHTLGISYMDDNIKKSKTPALISLSYFIRLLGPAFGYGLASICLKMYISPYLTPMIDPTDSRWLGAWWLGWLVLAIPIYLLTILMAMFPKELPKTYLRNKLRQVKVVSNRNTASLGDMITTFKRLITNKIFILNNMAAVFYFMGFTPYWIFTPKYIETQYRQTASVSSLSTGMIGLVFSALGILVSGIVISKVKPTARWLAAWNVCVGFVEVAGMCLFPFIGCPQNDQSTQMIETHDACNVDCNCDFVKYSPVCSLDTPTPQTFISPCHAGCTTEAFSNNGTQIYSNCSCIASGLAASGACPVDCTSMFYMFLIVLCIIKFVGASGRASNFLVSVRCVEEHDKPTAMGFGIMITSLFAFIPSPILFGSILDKTCLVWGKTCTGTGNCWLYDAKTLRYVMNFTASAFVTIGVFIDSAVWYYVKNLQIFDDIDHKVKDRNETDENKTSPRST